MEYGKTELIRILRNVMRQGWSDQKIKDLVDSLWRDKYPGADEVIYGGVVWNGGLNFIGSRAFFRLNNRLYNAPQTAFPLDAADATFTRIDIVTLNIDGEWEVIKGTPSAYPMPSSDYNRDTNLFVTPITIPAAATQPANMVEGQIYNEHIAGEWTPSVVGTTADWDSTVGPSIGAKCAAIGALTNGDMIVFTAPEDYTDTDWATLSFDLQLPNADSKGHFIEAYFTRNGSAQSKLVPATFSRTNLGWQTVVFAIPDFAVRNAIFNGLVLRWNKQGTASYAGIKIDNVRLQKGIELPATTDNYSTGIGWDEATQTLTIYRTGSLGPLVKQLTGLGGGGEDGREVEISTSGGYIVWRYVGETVWTNICPVPVDGDDGHTPYIQGGYWYINGVNTGVLAAGTPGTPGRGVSSVLLHSTVGKVKTYRMTFTDSSYFDYDVTDGADGTGGGVTQVTGLTILASGWVADGSLFKYVLSNANITATSIVEVIPAKSAHDVLVVAEPMEENESAAGTVTVWAKAIPTADISVTINITETV